MLVFKKETFFCDINGGDEKNINFIKITYWYPECIHKFMYIHILIYIHTHDTYMNLFHASQKKL